MSEVVDRDSLQDIVLDDIVTTRSRASVVSVVVLNEEEAVARADLADGSLGGTVSLFVAELTFGEELVGTDARLGVLVGSLVAAFLGTVILVPGEVDHDRAMDEHTPGHTDGVADSMSTVGTHS